MDRDAPCALARRVLGPRWWEGDPVAGQAEALAAVIAQGTCPRHAGWLGDLVGLAIRNEAARRALLPGAVDVRFTAITEEPWEEISSADARLHGLPVISRVKAFVASSSLSAIVELDCHARRARVSLQLGDVDPPATTVLESRRLVHTTAGEISHLMRVQRIHHR
jgi:hypothetical protein